MELSVIIQMLNYSDAIKITTPRTSTWPKDANVVTIGDLFKYTFPDITTNTFIQPPKGVTSDGFNVTTDDAKVADLKSWEKDFKSTPDIKEKFDNAENLNSISDIPKAKIFELIERIKKV
jgi:hypothetical protein